MIVQAGNLFSVIVDLINAGTYRDIDLFVLVAQILIGGFKLIHQPF
ncbi:Uncharacterised protein [Shigella flexneri]|nr:Uncharacterised protein [Shigella flexneri]